MAQRVEALNSPTVFGTDHFYRWNGYWANTGASTFTMVKADAGEVIHLMGIKVNSDVGSTGDITLQNSAASGLYSIWMGSTENFTLDFSPIGGLVVSCGAASNILAVKTTASNSHGFAWGVVSRVKAVMT